MRIEARAVLLGAAGLCFVLGAAAYADKRIDQLPAAEAISGTTIVPVYNSGTTSRTTVGAIWSSPGPIGTGTPSSGRFTDLTATNSFAAPSFASSGDDGSHFLNVYNTTTYQGINTTGTWRDSASGPERHDGTGWVPLNRNVMSAPSAWVNGYWEGRAITGSVSANVGAGTLLYRQSPGVWTAWSGVNTSTMPSGLSLTAITTTATGTVLLDPAIVCLPFGLGTGSMNWYAGTVSGQLIAAPPGAGFPIVYVGENLGVCAGGEGNVLHFRPGRAWGVR